MSNNNNDTLGLHIFFSRGMSRYGGHPLLKYATASLSITAAFATTRSDARERYVCRSFRCVSTKKCQKDFNRTHISQSNTYSFQTVTE